MISRKNYHSHELAKKLKEKDHSIDEIKESIYYLKELGYLNDEDYLKAFQKKALEKGWSSLEIKSKLYQKGIKDEIDSDEKESIRQFIKKKKIVDSNKLKQTLYRKGFSIDSINSLLGND